MPGTTQEMLCGVYRIPLVVSSGRSVVTNTTPVAPYRGAGRPEATALVERAMDKLAAELGMDPVELRRTNFIRPEEFPHTTVTGVKYDTGDYEKALDEALRLVGYEVLRAEQAIRRERGDEVCLGIGVATYVEITAFGGREYAAVEIGTDGRATVFIGTTSAGHGHETAFAQLASASLGVPFEDVTVVHSDTGLVARGEGTWGSRSLQIGGSSVFEQAEAVVEKGREVAAALLEVDAVDVERVEGGFAVVGVPDRAVGWSEVVGASDGGLRAEGRFRQRGSTFPFGAHVAVVEVDTATGEVRLLRHVAVDDCGRILNPALVRGQQHGGLAQGIAQALFEEVLYDESGNPVTSTLATYQMPSAADLPPFETANTETPTDLNPLGAKGSVSRPRSARPRRCRTRSSMPCPTSASGTSTCRSPPSGSGTLFARHHKGRRLENRKINQKLTKGQGSDSPEQELAGVAVPALDIVVAWRRSSRSAIGGRGSR